MQYSEGTARPGEIKRFSIQKGDVLITKDSETPDDIGVPALVVDDLPNTICGYHLAIIRPNGTIDSGFLALHLQSEATKRHFLRFANGVTRFGLGLRAIGTLPVPVPPLDEQRAIARILDAVDVAIEQTRAALAAIERLKRGLMQQALKRCSKAKAPIERLDKVAEIGSGVTLGRDLSGSATVELPYLRVANVQDGFLDLGEIKTVKVRPSEVERFSLAAGDVLLTEGGDFDKLGRGAVWTGEISPCLHQNHVFRVRADRTKLEPHFLATLIGSEYGKRFFLRIAKRTTNLASINKTQLKSFPVILPSLKEQETIVSLLSGVDRLIKSKEAASRNLDRLKRGLMQDLLTGRVRVKPPTTSGNGVVRSRP
jgi:type I restriction enzyme S subunit